MMATCCQLVLGTYIPPNSPQYPFVIIDYPHSISLQHLYILPITQIPLLNTSNTCIYSQNTYLPIPPDLFKELITPKTSNDVSSARLVRRPDAVQQIRQRTDGPCCFAYIRKKMHFILTSNKKLSVVDMLPSLVEDLIYMERDFVAYSSFYGEDVLVVSPLCFIAADSPRHAELCNLTGHSASYFCRKCLQKKGPNPNTLKRNPTYTQP
ncbi:hypothetical protein EDC96DRAFT_550628 [Choanephora cucurbitarum]|nr:hypothetical protein EDC96DRAFT_550628 [Choanephora cucurbitarum]